MNKKKKLLIALSVLLSMLLLTGVYSFILLEDYRQDRERYHYIAQNEIENIITTIDCIMARTYTLKAMVQDHEGDTQFFEAISRDIYTSVKDETGVSLKNIALAPDGVVNNVYPIGGNESLMNFNLMDASKPGNKEAIEAYEKGQTILTNPFKLVQGGMGVAGRAPVMVHKNGVEKLWGLVTVTIDFENLIDTLNLDNLPRMGISYELSFIDDAGNANVMATAGMFKSSPVVTDFNVRNLNWRITMMPEEGWVNVGHIIGVMLVFIALSAMIGVFVAMFLKLQISNEKLEYLSYRDGLTGAYSRNYVKSVLLNDGEWNNEKMKYSLLLVDIDDFKHFNDDFGHEVGDKVIVAVADILKKYVNERCGDCVIRFGGDEFVVLVNDVTKEKMAEMVENIMKDLHAAGINGADGLNINVSGGVSLYEENGMVSYQMMMRGADEKLYKAKENGKNRIEI